MKIIYKPVFDLHLWHDYFGEAALQLSDLPVDYDISNILKVVPTSECLTLLRNLRWLMRSQPGGITLLGEVMVDEALSTASERPQVPISQPHRLTFWLEVSDRAFANYTNLPFTASRHQILYFSNRSDNAQSYSFPDGDGGTTIVDTLFLSQRLPTYTGGEEYVFGQLVTHDAGETNPDTLEAIQYQSSALSSINLDTWTTLTPTQYVSGLDYQPLQGITRTEVIATANPEDIFRFTLTDRVDQVVFSHDVIVADTHPPGTALQVPLNFFGVPIGYYRLALNGTPVDEFVLFNAQSGANRIGLIEIGIEPAIAPASSADPFALLVTSGEHAVIRHRDYIVRFKNRSTLWRYHTQLPHGLTGDVLPDDLQILDEQTYITTHPQGLRHRPNPPPLTNGDRPLPFPSAARIKPELDSERHVTQVFSDIYL